MNFPGNSRISELRPISGQHPQTVNFFQEFFRVWSKDFLMIFNSMNDKVKNFLEKVLDRLKKQTQFENRSDSRMVYWSYPFHDTLSTALPYKYINQDINDSQFFKHCRDMYGLRSYEIRYVWDRYYEWITNELSKRNHSYK